MITYVLTLATYQNELKKLIYLLHHQNIWVIKQNFRYKKNKILLDKIFINKRKFRSEYLLSPQDRLKKKKCFFVVDVSEGADTNNE